MSESFSTMKATPSLIAPTCEVSGKDFSKSEINSANFAKARRSFSQSSSSISLSVFSKTFSSIVFTSSARIISQRRERMSEIMKDSAPSAELSMLNRIERDLVQVYIAILEIQKANAVANTVSKLNLVTLIISFVALIVALIR